MSFTASSLTSILTLLRPAALCRLLEAEGEHNTQPLRVVQHCSSHPLLDYTRRHCFPTRSSSKSVHLGSSLYLLVPLSVHSSYPLSIFKYRYTQLGSTVDDSKTLHSSRRPQFHANPCPCYCAVYTISRILTHQSITPPVALPLQFCY